MATTTNTDVLIDNLTGNKGLDADIALLAQCLLKSSIRYYSALKRWEIYHQNQWTVDTKGDKVWEMMRTIVGMEIVKRALYWENESSKCNMKDDSELLFGNECSRKSLVLMEINQRFHQRSNKKKILEEMKPYFDEGK